MAKKPLATECRFVVVCTENRGVFFGRLTEDKAPNKVILTDARNCIYWSNDIKGILGLASNGPSKSCRIGPSVPQLTLWKITAVIDCTPDAIKQWESNPWNS